MRDDNYPGGMAGVIPWDGDGEEDLPPLTEDDGEEAGAAGILAPMARPQTGLAGDIRRLGGALRTRHDWQPPTIREQREDADPADPHQRWVGGPATGLLVILLLILHDRGHSRAAAAVTGGALAVLIVIVVLLLTHKGI